MFVCYFCHQPADGSDYLVGLEEVMMNRKTDSSASQGMELVLMLRVRCFRRGRLDDIPCPIQLPRILASADRGTRI